MATAHGGLYFMFFCPPPPEVFESATGCVLVSGEPDHGADDYVYLTESGFADHYCSYPGQFMCEEISECYLLYSRLLNM